MKRFFLIVFLIRISLMGYSQIYIEGSYYPSRTYTRNSDGTKGNADAVMMKTGLMIPLSIQKRGAELHPTVWALSMSGSYVHLGEEKDSKGFFPIHDYLNTQLSLVHLRSFNERWGLKAFLGTGIASDHTDWNNLTADNLLLHGLGALTYRFNKDLEIGFGLLFNRYYAKFIMAYPAVIFNWKHGEKYMLEASSFLYDFNCAAGININRYLNLKWTFVYNYECTASYLREELMHCRFSYTQTAFQPEIKLNKYWKIPIMLGLSKTLVGYSRKEIMGFFKYQESYSSSWKPYFSIALRYTVM